MRRVTVIAMAVFAVAVGCSNSHSNTLRLGAVYPLAGAQGPGGLEEYRGVQLAVQRANATGGVGGRHVQLVTKDVERAEAAPEAVQELSAAGLHIVLGSYGSTISAPASAQAAKDHMLFWETGAVGLTAESAGAGSTFFRVAPTGGTLGRAAVSFVRDELAGRLQSEHELRYAVAYVDDAYGTAVGMGAIDEAQGSGQQLVGTFPYASQGTDYTALAARVAAVHPDVLFVSAYLQDGVALRKSMLAAHVPLLASIGTSSSYCLPQFGQELGQDAVGLFASDKPDAADVRPSALQRGARSLLSWASASYQHEFHTAMSAAALAGFSNAWALLHDVMPAAKALTVPDLAAAALRTKLPMGSLPNGSGLDFAAPGQVDAGSNRRAASVIWEWVGPGRRAVVWPPSFANHPLDLLPING